MGLLGKLWTLVKGLVGGKLPKGVKGRDPRPFLSGQAPGQWATNHLAEAAAVQGWNFVAIRTMARMAASAELSVHEQVGAGRKRQAARLRSRLRLARTLGDVPTQRALRRRLDRLKASAPTAQGTREERRPVPHNDPLLTLLKQPNPNWSGSLLRYQAIQQLAATGSAIVWKVCNGVGAPVELYVIPTGLAIPRLPTAEFPEGSYSITPLSSWGLAPQGDGWATGALGGAMLSGAEVDARDVKAVRWPHPLYLSDGLSPAAAVSLWVDVANEMDRSCFYGLQNSECPGMVFKQDPAVEPDPGDKAQFRDDLAAEHAGTPNTGKHLVLPPGIDSVDRGRTAADLDYTTGRADYRNMVLAAHGVSPVAAGIGEAGNYSAFWASVKQTTEIAVQPMLDLLAEDLTQFLGAAWPDGRREVNYKARAIDDPQLLENRLATDTKAGNVLLVKEYRSMRGLPPLGDERDEQFVGVKTTIRAEDDDLSKPGLQHGDKPGSDKDTGTKQPARNAPPGRQDRGGKAHDRSKGYDPNQPRVPAGSPEGGEWTEGGDGSGKESDTDGENNHDATVRQAVSEKLTGDMSLEGATGEEATAILSALRRSLSAAGRDFTLRSVRVVEHTPVDAETGGLSYASGVISITRRFLASARANDPDRVRESLKGTGGERNYTWQDGHTPQECVQIAVAHEVGHHVAGALLLDFPRAIRAMNDEAGAPPSEEDRVKVSGYATDSLGELFAEVHAFMTTGREGMVPAAVRDFYNRALATADPEPIETFIRKRRHGRAEVHLGGGRLGAGE